ncbi:MAG: helix-turn-helix transcriptional regulator [Gemmatimonadetes bacterium]|nr:helix-turn-helix transcriptional regulator [Gemmatimonadota bacterium]
MGRQLGYATIAVLRAVRNGYGYGTEIMDRTGLPSGTVYPTLSRMDERGYLRSRWEKREKADAERRPRRRYYRLTPSGEQALDAAIRQLASLADEVGPVANAALEKA